ncbi:MAG: response regulator [Desulfobacterales bacterium]|nr:response regulator [Desulfobacterales bacterium]MBF0397626.1 response regulator [Desulfobacterales bacterium]
MSNKKDSIIILLAEDDEDDYLLIEKSLKKAKILNKIKWVKDGVELMDYLKHRGEYKDVFKSPKPHLILLDLNMPRKDGRESLKDIKSDPALKNIPVIVLTTSKSEEDIFSSYNLGVNSFIRKPTKFDDFVKAIQLISQYWFELVELPIEEKF